MLSTARLLSPKADPCSSVVVVAPAASTDFVFTKSAAVLPVVAVIGGGDQEFSVSSGIRVQTAIDLATVCSGE